MIRALRLAALLAVFVLPMSAAEPVALAGRAMGTTWTIKFLQPAPPLDLATLQARIAETLERLEQQFSTYRPGSELFRFNAAASNDWIAVSSEIVRVALASRELSARTDGAFDATVAPLVALWGFGLERRDGSLPSATALAAARTRVDYRRLEARLDPPALRKTTRDLAADFSSMAKGFAADAVSGLLTGLGAPQHIVQMGGDIRTAGARVWPVGIEHPAPGRTALAATVALAGQALSTSGDAHQFFEHAGRRYGHIIDPRTGEPVAGALASVSVIRATCADSSSLATALFVLGAGSGFDFAVREHIAALFIVRRGENFELQPTPEFAQLAASGGR
jgi:thiamine biosynthesis lipoprotein